MGRFHEDDEIYEREKKLEKEAITFLAQLISMEINQKKEEVLDNPSLEVTVYILKKICQ